MGCPSSLPDTSGNTSLVVIQRRSPQRGPQRKVLVAGVSRRPTKDLQLLAAILPQRKCGFGIDDDSIRADQPRAILRRDCQRSHVGATCSAITAASVVQSLAPSGIRITLNPCSPVAIISIGGSCVYNPTRPPPRRGRCLSGGPLLPVVLSAFSAPLLVI
jgi:hypothetical protein